MTIVYPRFMPEIGDDAISFEVTRVDYISPEVGGNVGAISAGFPMWHLKLSLTNLDVPDADIWRAFIASLRGSSRIFFGRDLRRDRPRLPRNGAYSPVANAWSQAINDAGDAELSLEGLLVGMPLVAGDYVGFRWDANGSEVGANDRKGLTRVVQGGTADADGNLTVIVEPPVPNVVPSGSEAYFTKPDCLMRLVPGGYDLGQQTKEGYTAQGGNIEAVQVLLP